MKNDNNLAKQAATVVSIVEDFAEKNKMNVILCISSGQEQVGCALYSGNVEENADALFFFLAETLRSFLPRWSLFPCQ